MQNTQQWLGHPRGLSTLFFTEMWERFSYYGMRAILVLAMVAAVQGENPGLGITKETALAIYGLYTSAVYLSALPGGWIGDRLIGPRNAVFWGGVIIACGHFCMALNTTPSFFIGLILIALGTGLLKPNVSVLVGQLYSDAESARKDAAYSIFYMGINAGSFLGKILCGYLGEKVGWHWGFGVAGVFMVLGLIQYKLSAHYLGNIGIAAVSSGNPAKDAQVRRRGWSAAAIFVAGIVCVVLAVLGGALVINAVSLAKIVGLFIALLAFACFAGLFLFGGLTPIEKKRVAVIVVLFIGAALFWSGFEQAGSSFSLFAKEHTDRIVWGWEIPASWIQAVNPLLIVILSPFFAALWVHLGKRNLNPSTPLKFGLGLLQLSIGFAVLAWASVYVAAGEKVAPTWLLLTYLFHTMGELCLSPVGLAAVNKLSPARYQGQMFGMWFTASALGKLIAGLLAGHLAQDADAAGMSGRFLFVFLTTAGAGTFMLLLARPVQRLMGDPKQG
ncbi:MAG: peptide MFS transporter [Pseudomonadota bacterium]|nr:peptide MFS transporter [Pseudomonadota bacterium]